MRRGTASGKEIRTAVKIGGIKYEAITDASQLTGGLKRLSAELASAGSGLALVKEKSTAACTENAKNPGAALKRYANTLLDMLELFAGSAARNAAYELFGGEPAKICAELPLLFAEKLLPAVTASLLSRRKELQKSLNNGEAKEELFFLKRRIKLNMFYDRVLAVYALWREELLTDGEKIRASLKLLVKNGRKLLGFSQKQKWRLLEEIFENFITGDKNTGNSGEKLLDFNRDFGYIYASFMADYRIDLYSERGRLKWRRFLALFQGLSEGTKIREVINVRACKIPEKTVNNAAEVDGLTRLKEYYALGGSPAETEKRFENAIGELASLLEKTSTFR